MRYKKVYRNKHFRIEVDTDMQSLHNLINNFLDFEKTSKIKVKPIFDIKYRILESKNKLPMENTRFTYKGLLTSGKSLSYDMDLAKVKLDYRKNEITVDIINFLEHCKERLLDLIFFKPLYVLMLNRCWLFLHAAMVRKGNDVILIVGGQGAGKTSLALALGRSGYSVLSDDDCFVRFSKNKVEAIPFPTKVGLNSKNLKKYPELKENIVKDFLYGNKMRVSLRHICSKRTNIEKSYNCRTVLFPEYCVKKKSKMVKLKGQDILKGFLANSYETFEGKFWIFNDIARKVTGYKLLYKDSDLRSIGDIVEQAHSPKL